MDRIVDGLEEHEGSAGQLLDDGSVTGTYSSETEARMVGRVVAACGCGWTGDEQYPTEGLFDDVAEERALGEWYTNHAAVLLVDVVPAEVRTSAEDLGRQLFMLSHERPLAALSQLSVIAEWAETHTQTAVANARDGGASWSDVGKALGTSKQAAWQRYG